MSDFRSEFNDFSSEQKAKVTPNPLETTPTPVTGASPYAARAEKHERWVATTWKIFKWGFAFLILSVFVLTFFTPSFKQLEDPRFNVASDVYAADEQTVLGRYFIQNRSPVSFAQLSPNLVNALVATEDSRFYEHSGIDPEALARVFVKTFLLFDKGQGGGSTVTQQLAKLLYTDRNMSKIPILRQIGLYKRKMIEWITAVKLERSYTKEEIMAMYLNQVDYVNGAYGIRAASEIYFAKSPKDVNVQEAATLIGMLQNPALYNPIRRNEKCKTRRNIVLGRMAEQKKITATDLPKLQASPVDVSRFKLRNHAEGLAPYFRMEMLKDIQEILKSDKTPKHLDGSNYDIYRDGLKVYTSIDPETQRAAEESMREHMSGLQKKFFNVWKGKDPWTYKLSDTKDEEIVQRKRQLVQNMRESDRYEAMRDLILGGSLDVLEASLENYRISDTDIELSIKEEQQPGYLNAGVGNKTIRSERADMCRRMMGNQKEWAEVKKNWTKLQAQVLQVFNTPIKMKVFAYGTPTYDRDTTMSPLDSIRYHRMHLQIGAVALDPATGFVRAWVGGVNHKYFQYDHVRSSRQVGSTIKPLVYAAAMSQLSLSPCKAVADVPTTIGVGESSFGLATAWTPKNSGSYSGSYLTLWDCLKESKNTASVWLLKQFGSTAPVRNLMNDMGIDANRKYPNGQYRVTQSPSLCLGAVDLTSFEMAGAYGAFANDGKYNRPRFIMRITDRNGKELYSARTDSKPGDFKQVLSSDVNYTMVRMLKYVAQGASGLTGLKSEIGGKTGTTNDFVDGWFVGITPKLVVSTWVGGEDNFIRFNSINEGQGSVMARPFFAKLITKLEANPKAMYDGNAKFKSIAPEQMSITLDCSQYSEGAGGSAIENPNKGKSQDDFDEGDVPKPATPANPTAPKPAVPKPAVPKEDFEG
jgi:penicillin-binding protein 1A